MEKTKKAAVKPKVDVKPNAKVKTKSKGKPNIYSKNMTTAERIAYFRSKK